jgi:hypothetical protein
VSSLNSVPEIGKRGKHLPHIFSFLTLGFLYNSDAIRTLSKELMDLAASVKLAHTAVQFVEGGPLAEALAELDMSAAIAALNKAHQARDKHAQVWSAVNHLERAQTALESKLRRHGAAIAVLRIHHLDELIRKRGYILALMAICYRYLGEEQLAQQAIAAASLKSLYSREKDKNWLLGAAGANTDRKPWPRRIRLTVKDEIKRLREPACECLNMLVSHAYCCS